MRCQTYGHLPSHRASPSFDLYQSILPGNMIYSHRSMKAWDHTQIFKQQSNSTRITSAACISHIFSKTNLVACTWFLRYMFHSQRATYISKTNFAMYFLRCTQGTIHLKARVSRLIFILFFFETKNIIKCLSTNYSNNTHVSSVVTIKVKSEWSDQRDMSAEVSKHYNRIKRLLLSAVIDLISVLVHFRKIVFYV